MLRENAEEYDCFIHDWDKNFSFIVPLYNYEDKIKSEIFDVIANDNVDLNLLEEEQTNAMDYFNIILCWNDAYL